ncbi:MAG: hypothetical protein PHP25_02880 [Candidatus Moranbacteria bacterium]|nr:hypothetical protein [Candidatus Moranbacteria bacterium]
MKKFKFLLALLPLLGILLTIGCGPELQGDMKKIGQTQHREVYAAMAAATNERGPAATAVTIFTEEKHPGWQQTVINNPNAAAAPSAPPQLAQWTPPKDSPRGKKALRCPTPATPPAKPAAPAQPVVITTTTSPQLQVIGGAGGAGKSTLQSWGDQLLGSLGNAAPAAVGGYFYKEGQRVRRPDQTNIGVTQQGGGAAVAPISNTQGQGQLSINNNNNALNNTNNSTSTNTNNASGVGVAAAESN